MANAVYYSAAFHLPSVNTRTPLGTLTLRQPSETNIVVNLATLTALDANGLPSSWFWHFPHWFGFTMVGSDPVGTTRYPHYAATSIAAAITTLVQAQQTTLGWASSNFTLSWLEQTFSGSVALPHYRITNAGNSITLQFSTLAGAALFGAPETTTESSTFTSYEFTNVPRFVVFPASQMCGATAELDAHDYEPQGVASHVIADDGTGYGNARSCAYYHRDWQQQFETAAKSYRLYATSAHPETHESLRQYCRSHIPYYVAHGFGPAPRPQYEVFINRDSGNFHKPISASLANHYWTHHDFRTIYVGSLPTPT